MYIGHCYCSVKFFSLWENLAHFEYAVKHVDGALQCKIAYELQKKKKKKKNSKVSSGDAF